MSELVWKYNVSDDVFKRIIKFMSKIAVNEGIKYKTFNTEIDKVIKKTDKDSKTISIWTEFNKDFIGESFTSIKGIKYYNDKEDDFYKSLYYLGYGDGKKRNCFGRLVLNKNTMDYYPIIIAATKIVDGENVIMVDDYDNTEPISKKVSEYMRVWSNMGG